jgi:sirohydrochlorin cobaltochelatase
MAHGGSPQWNKAVRDMVRNADLPYPTRIFFGMAHSREEADLLQKNVNYLEGKGVHTIIVIPLLVSSYSEIHRQWRYMMGVNIQPGFNTGLFPVKKQATIEFTDPLNDDPIVGLILLDRARELSQNPSSESVILVAHGPNDESDNARWLAAMSKLAATVKERGHFRAAEGLTLRDDAPEEIRAQAVETLRGRVERGSKMGKVIVIPLLMAPGGVENKIGVALKGLDYALNAKTLMPDHRLSQWVRSKVP